MKLNRRQYCSHTHVHAEATLTHTCNIYIQALLNNYNANTNTQHTTNRELVLILANSFFPLLLKTYDRPL
jgi:hypothetical protein